MNGPRRVSHHYSKVAQCPEIERADVAVDELGLEPKGLRVAHWVQSVPMLSISSGPSSTFRVRRTWRLETACQRHLDRSRIWLPSASGHQEPPVAPLDKFWYSARICNRSRLGGTGPNTHNPLVQEPSNCMDGLEMYLGRTTLNVCNGVHVSSTRNRTARLCRLEGS